MDHSSPASAASELAQESSSGYPGRRVVVGSAIGVFVGFGSLLVYTFGIFLKPLAEEFAWSRQSVSLAFGFAAIALAASSPILGLLLDRYGPRRVILPCLTVYGLAFASLSLLTPRLWHLYAVFFLLGMIGNGAAHLAYARTVSTWFVQRRGLALALILSGGAIGAMVLPPLAQALIHGFGWRGAYASLGGLVLILGWPAVFFLVRDKPESGRAHGVEVHGASVQQGLRSRAFWILVAVLFLASLCQNGVVTHLSALLTDRGVAAGGAAIAISTMGASSLIGRLAAGWLLDRFFAPRVGCGLLLCATLGTFLLSGVHSAGMGILAAGLIGAGMGGEADVTPYLLSRYFGLRSFSTLYGFTWTAYAFAGAIGPVLMGKAFDVTGSYTAFLLNLVVVAIVASGLMLLLPDYRKQEIPTQVEVLVARRAAVAD
jgi:MFS family permease